LIQTEGEVEALRVVIATSVLDGEGVGMKVGTGKSRTDRRRIPCKPIEYRIIRKKTKLGKIREKSAKSGAKSGEGFSRPNSWIPYLTGNVPVGIPVFLPYLNLLYSP
jgi:hypothetical protein